MNELQLFEQATVYLKQDDHENAIGYLETS